MVRRGAGLAQIYHRSLKLIREIGIPCDKFDTGE